MPDPIEQLITNLDVDSRQISRQVPEVEFPMRTVGDVGYYLIGKVINANAEYLMNLHRPPAIFIPPHHSKARNAEFSDDSRRRAAASPKTATRSPSPGPMSTANLTAINPKLIDGGKR